MAGSPLAGRAFVDAKGNRTISRLGLRCAGESARDALLNLRHKRLLHTQRDLENVVHKALVNCPLARSEAVDDLLQQVLVCVGPLANM